MGSMEKVGPWLSSRRVSVILNVVCFVQLIALYYNGFRLGINPNKMIGVPQWPPSGAILEVTEQKIGPVQSQPIIFMITPTVHTPVRKADITRLAQTLRQVPNLHWIVVEDGNELCPCVTNILHRLIPSYTYLAAPTPDFTTSNVSRWLKGIFQRNAGLEWVRLQYKDHQGSIPRGVVYFGDDDNSYDLRLFEMMRDVRLLGVWPVAFVGSIMLEKPKINDQGKLIGFDVFFSPKRKFAVDMAGFALNLNLVISKWNISFAYNTPRYHMESDLLNSFGIGYDDVDVKGMDYWTPEGLLEPLVWHTQTAPIQLGGERHFRKKFQHHRSNYGWEV